MICFVVAAASCLANLEDTAVQQHRQDAGYSCLGLTVPLHAVGAAAAPSAD